MEITERQKTMLCSLTDPSVLLVHSAVKQPCMTFAQAVEYFEQQGLRYEFEERAAILEYDGGLGRDQAERQAINELFERTNHLTIDDRQLL